MFYSLVQILIHFLFKSIWKKFKENINIVIYPQFAKWRVK